MPTRTPAKDRPVPVYGTKLGQMRQMVPRRGTTGLLVPQIRHRQRAIPHLFPFPGKSSPPGGTRSGPLSIQKVG